MGYLTDKGWEANVAEDHGVAESHSQFRRVCWFKLRTSGTDAPEAESISDLRQGIHGSKHGYSLHSKGESLRVSRLLH